MSRNYPQIEESKIELVIFPFKWTEALVSENNEKEANINAIILRTMMMFLDILKNVA